MAILCFCKFYSFEDKQGLNSIRNIVGEAEWLRFFERQYDAPMRVLLVEDDTRIARFVARGLREQSYAVDVVGSGEEALYQAAINSYDLAILDVMIPPPDGFTVCKELRKSGQRMPILMLTARDGVDDRS